MHFTATEVLLHNNSEDIQSGGTYEKLSDTWESFWATKVRKPVLNGNSHRVELVLLKILLHMKVQVAVTCFQLTANFGKLPLAIHRASSGRRLNPDLFVGFFSFSPPYEPPVTVSVERSYGPCCETLAPAELIQTTETSSSSSGSQVRSASGKC